jgi:hypothetical protein
VTRRQFAMLVVMLSLVIAVSVSAPAFPQEDPAPIQELDATDAQVADAEAILLEQTQLQVDQPFKYRSSGRRDPFRSLMTQTEEGVKRPPGIAGMMVTELDLAGTVNNQTGDVAMVIGSDNKGYFLRVGDQVYDGTVIAVDTRQGAVTFRQKVDDPRLIKPFRDVVKRLVPLEESTNE